MQATIGIRRETKNAWERRAPLTPSHVRELVARGVRVVVQPAANRIFPDAAYAEAGAELKDDLSDCRAVFAVKEIPLEELLPDKTYAFFSHTIKGQRHNMPLLQRVLDLGCRLIDYEKIADDEGRRLIFFGRHAGYAGMIDALHVLGRRLAIEGVETPFSQLQMAHGYAGLAAAKAQLGEIGRHIATDGLPDALFPFIVAFAGYGNVSTGAQEVFDCLPVESLTPAQLEGLDPGTLSRHKAYKVIYKEADLVAPLALDQPFELAHYYANPAAYAGRFGAQLSRFTVVMNCLYWEPAYPRLITRRDVEALWGSEAAPRLKVIGDLGCDIEGPIEFTLKATDQAQPTFVYLPATGTVLDGLAGDGPVVLAIDNLPCELPGEASQAFSDALLPFAAAIAHAEAQELPAAIARAVIAEQGHLMPSYHYLNAFLEKAASL